METKDTLSSCSNSEEQQMKQIQDKAKKSCMVSFRQLHSHLKLLSNNDLQGTRSESGFKRVFATLFGQDIETFTGTMFVYVDQLDKQLDKEEFQEIGSMASFKVLETEFQMFIKSRIYLDDEYVVMTRNYFLQYTQLAIPEFRDTLIQHIESVKKSIDERAHLEHAYDNWRKGRGGVTACGEDGGGSGGGGGEEGDKKHRGGTWIGGGEMGSIKDDAGFQRGPDNMMKSQWLRWKPMGKFFKTASLRWVPTRKIFTSSITNVDSEPTNGSNDDIMNQYECKKTLDVSACTLNIHEVQSLNPQRGIRVCSELRIHKHINKPSSSKLVPKVVPPADKTTTS
ncbi:hypothetical protein Tco_0700067 [Tanacetum coccineum]